MQQIRNLENYTLNTTFSYVTDKQPPVRKKSIKWIFFLAFLVFIVLSLSLYGWFSGVFHNMSFFSIFALHKITVYGIQGSNADLVKQSLSEFSGKNLLTLSSDQINENLSKFGFIEGFLLRKTYPSEITIEIKLKPSVGFLKKEGKFYEIDGAGSFWESFKTPDSFLEADSSVDLSDLNLQRIVKAMNELKCSNLCFIIKQNGSDAFLIVTKDNTKLIVSGRDFQTQWEKYIKSKSFIEKNFGGGGTVDLRWSNRLVLLPENKSNTVKEDTING